MLVKVLPKVRYVDEKRTQEQRNIIEQKVKECFSDKLTNLSLLSCHTRIHISRLLIQALYCCCLYVADVWMGQIVGVGVTIIRVFVGILV
jgi:hypothetical protein